MTESAIHEAETGGAALDDLARVLGSFLRVELEVPVHDVDGFIDLLTEDARRDGMAAFLADLDKMKAASQKLEGIVAGLLDSLTADLSLPPEEIERVSARVRHDLRTPLTAIIGYGELLSEEARDEGFETWAGTLDGLIDASRRLLDQIDVMVTLLRRQNAAEGGPDSPEASPAHLQEAVETIKAVLTGTPHLQPRVQGRILVVDDNMSNLDLLSRRLARDGHEVSVCDSGEAALALLAEGAWDLVLLDLIMPGLNGIDVLRQIRSAEATRNLPVIMVSALEEVDGAVRCIEAGADDFLSKPLDPVLLRARMNAALERKALRDRETEILRSLEAERERAEALLRNVLPVSVVARLRAGETVIADHFDAVTILFCDLVGFTSLAGTLRPEETLDLLNGIFSAFDRLAARNGLEKIKTIGDAYMAAGGLPAPRADHAAAVAEMALRMPEVVRQASRKAGRRLDCRIGLHTGPAVAGIIGTHKFVYDVWGDTVNIASRMEHHGVPGRVHVTAQTRDALGERYRFEPLPPMDIKGKGIMQTFLIR